MEHLRPLFSRLSLVGDAYLAVGATRVLAPTFRYRQARTERELATVFDGVERAQDLSLAVRPQGGNAISRNPAKGVVGPDFRVHGTKNVFVCDASVFPTAVAVAPTLTALGLAEYASYNMISGG